MSDEVHVWVFWINLGVLVNGQLPADCNINFNTRGVVTNPQNLGPIRGQIKGLEQAHGRVCIQGTLAPVGINQVLRTGLRITRTIVREKTWTDGALSDKSNIVDTNIRADQKQWVPNAQDHIYDLDAPNIACFAGNLQAFIETYVAFQQQVTYYGQTCSNIVDWYFLGEFLTGTPAPLLQPHPVPSPQRVQFVCGTVANVNRVDVQLGVLNVAAINAPRYVHTLNGIHTTGFSIIDLDNSGEKP